MSHSPQERLENVASAVFAHRSKCVLRKYMHLVYRPLIWCWCCATHRNQACLVLRNTSQPGLLAVIPPHLNKAHFLPPLEVFRQSQYHSSGIKCVKETKIETLADKIHVAAIIQHNVETLCARCTLLNVANGRAVRCLT